MAISRKSSLISKGTVFFQTLCISDRLISGEMALKQENLANQPHLDFRILCESLAMSPGHPGGAPQTKLAVQAGWQDVFPLDGDHQVSWLAFSDIKMGQVFQSLKLVASPLKSKVLFIC